MSRSGFVKVDFRIGDYFDCDDVAKAFAVLIYRGNSQQNNKQKGFYKFFDKCATHLKYKPGDSLCEELRMPRKRAKKALSPLVNHHKTKTDFDEAENKFNGKLFASYTNRRTHLTHYFVNWEAVYTFLTSIGAYIPSFVKNHFTTIPPISKEVSTPSSSAFCLPYNQLAERQIDPSLCAGNTNTFLQTNTHTNLHHELPKVDDPFPTPEEVKLSLEMKEIWNTKQPNKVNLYPSQAKQLCKALREHFNNSLEAFKRYCDAIASSDFLTGKANNSGFKAILWWAIKPGIIGDIRAGKYGVKATETQHTSSGGDNPPTLHEVYDHIESLQEDKLSKHFRENVANTIGAAAYKSALGKTEIIDGYKDGQDGELHVFVPAELGNFGVEYLMRYSSGLQQALNECPPHLANKIVVYIQGNSNPAREIIRTANPTPRSAQVVSQPQRTSFEGSPYAVLN